VGVELGVVIIEGVLDGVIVGEGVGLLDIELDVFEGSIFRLSVEVFKGAGIVAVLEGGNGDNISVASLLI
jgi:hypothetical protein